MQLFSKSESEKLQRLVDNFPYARKEMNADEIKQYLVESVALIRKIDEAMQTGSVRSDFTEKLKYAIRKKGLINDAIRFVVENKLYKK